ncbi:MAG: ABC transporter ATP-binding protein/permease [Bacilli bacterium]|nr:ABC transporter ATP-binding protein/permease [Bacilli bacterium]
MLRLKNIKKSYKMGNNYQHALKGINVDFRKNEFVSILGPSGSGKTTLLNVIGGLDRYDSGDLIINNQSTRKFKDKNWDAYRNNCIGFIFQSYNLIGHISVLKNVEMSTTLSGYPKRKRKQMAIEALEKVGLKEHINKKPNQLSGGQMQRVAIARALVNDPNIILADEPTGALDTKTSKQIMDLIKEVSKDKLVIMVTHNPDLAKEYSNRIIEFQDGEVINDSNPFDGEETSETVNIKRTKMSYLNAIGLSFNNLRTKKGRTILTAFASSIGIIGISLILSLSNGFQKQIDKFEKDTSDAMPIVINSTKVSTESITSQMSNASTSSKYEKSDKVSIKKSDNKMEYNNLNEEFINYLKDMNQKYLSSSVLETSANLNIYQTDGEKYFALDSIGSDNPMASLFGQGIQKAVIPYKNLSNTEPSYILTEYYDLVAGRLPKEKDELIIEIKTDNNMDEDFAKALNIKGDSVKYEDILNCSFKLIFNDDYYLDYGDYYIPKLVDKNLYENPNNLDLKVVGIIKVKESKSNIMNPSNGIYYSVSLQDYVIEKNSESAIVKKQREADYNVLSQEKFDLNTKEGKKSKEQTISYLGGNNVPSQILLYPKDFDNKENITKYIDKYNKGKSEEDKIAYLDQANLITTMSGGIMTGITAVLIAFSSISLVVSSIMIGIITYISVLERTKEIGILRSLGARKKDIRRVFNAETFIIGLTSGLLGIFISGALLIPINVILKNITDLSNVAVMDVKASIILIIVSITLTLIGGAIPSRLASKKDPAVSLRTE